MKFSLALLVLLAVLLVPSAAASGTTLCETPVSLCPAGERYPVPQKIQAALVPKTVAKFVTGLGTVECNESKFTAETFKNEGSEGNLRTEIGNWSFSNAGGECAIKGGGKCSTLQVGLPLEVWLLSLGGNGRVFFGEGLKVESVCAGLKCVYSKATTEMEFKGGGPGEASLNANAVKLEKAEGSNPICATTATVSAEYAISEPAKALWISPKP